VSCASRACRACRACVVRAVSRTRGKRCDGGVPSLWTSPSSCAAPPPHAPVLIPHTPHTAHARYTTHARPHTRACQPIKHGVRGGERERDLSGGGPRTGGRGPASRPRPSSGSARSRTPDPTLPAPARARGSPSRSPALRARAFSVCGARVRLRVCRACAVCAY
jgi:hypothetical protein